MDSPANVDIFVWSDKYNTGLAEVDAQHRTLVALLNELISHLALQAPAPAIEEVFARLRVWDTEENTGVLIYVQWVDRRVEILADRGIARLVPQSAWEAICRQMEADFRTGRFGAGSVAAVAAAGDLLANAIPAGAVNPNELPNKPVLL